MDTNQFLKFFRYKFDYYKPSGNSITVEDLCKAEGYLGKGANGKVYKTEIKTKNGDA